MVSLIDLPKYYAPQPLDFSPINKAIGFVADERQRDIANQRAERQLGMEEKKFSEDQRDRQIRRIGARAQAGIELAAKGDMTGAKAWYDKHFSSPEFQNAIKTEGLDPNDYLGVMKAFHAEALGPRDPLEAEAKRAQIAQSNAATKHAIGGEERAKEMQPYALGKAKNEAELAKIGKVKEDEQLYVIRPTGPEIVANPNGAGGDKKFRDEAAKSQVERYGEYIKTGDRLAQSSADMAQLREISNRIGEPGFQNTMARTIGPYARNLGIDINGMSDIEAFTAIVSRLAPSMRPPGSGATSDFEFKQYLQALPQLAQTKEGREVIMNQFDAFAAHGRNQAEIASRALNGDINRQDAERELRSLPSPYVYKRPKGDSNAAPIRIETEAEWNRLLPGSKYVAPDGTVRTKR